MTNLFSIFDPATSFLLPMNWLSALIFLFMMPIKKMMAPNRQLYSLMNMASYVFKELRPSTKKMDFILLISVSYFLFIMFNNVIGLFPYIFTASSHMSFTLTLALTAWMAMMLYGWLNNRSNLLVHLVPQGTPYILMPFMVVIEALSNLIRPGTLAIRLTANMIAGHLLLVLLSSSMMNSPMILTPLMFTAQIMLSSLELAVSFIQAYVFSVLITLYMAELTN